MHDSRTFQVHANVNSDHGDSALRVTITYYDEHGMSYHHQTWRAHVRGAWYEGADWQAYSACVDLAKMMGLSCKAGPLELDEPDAPLPGL